jgi:transcriptional regulator with XRE-family HTH domain
MSDHRETLGRRLQRLRAEAGMTQGQLAEAAGVAVSSLRNWEVDRREPSLRAAARLARALGTTAEHLADTAPVKEAGGKAARPAGPTKKPAGAHRGPAATKRRGRGRHD